MTWKRPLLRSLGMLLTALGPATAHAQDPAWSVRPLGGGWIGLDIDYIINVMPEGEQTVAVVKGVVEGSPAEAAGVRAGDTLTHIDGQAVSPRVLAALQEGLQPGDLVRLTVVQSGRRRDLMVEATRREVGPMAANLQELVVKLDTLRGAILKNLDSLRLSVIESRLDSIGGESMILQIRTLPSPTDTSGRPTVPYSFFQFGAEPAWFTPWPDSLGGWPRSAFVSPDFGIPFEAFLTTSPATDSLSAQLQQVRREIQEVRRQEEARRRELEATRRNITEESLRADEEIQVLRRREETLLSERDQLNSRLRRASESELQRQWVQAQSRAEEAMAEAQRARVEVLARSRKRDRAIDSTLDIYYLEGFRSRSLSPVIIGQNAILGAELQPLNPDLAAYFSVQGGVPVREGVVVLQVVDGTPAADAGLQGGDVIVRVGSDSVASIGDLRLAVSLARGSIPIQLVRKGKTMQVVISRR